MLELEQILVEDAQAPCFYPLTNTDGKCWVIPAQGMRTAMYLYQPSGPKGKLLKLWFPLLHALPPVRRVLRTQPVRYRLTDDLRTLADSLFGAGAEWALFGGTPCVHQKATLQFWREGKILGYLKLCNHRKVFRLFEHEQSVLDELNAAGVSGIPRCLGCGELREGLWYFAQSTVKTAGSRVPHEWSAMQAAFLLRLAQQTQKVCAFEDTDFYASMLMLQEHLDWLPDGALPVVQAALDEVLGSYAGQKVTFCASHGDFTPWNMFVERGELFVFDWEYAGQNYPPGIDYYHFVTQSAIFEQHADAAQIWLQMQPHLAEHADNRLKYMSYLLDILGRFTLREQGHAQGDELRCMQIWIELLKRLMK
ncbi:MAG: aminoglycoside phosphotransferase family protein [Akkermansia sp.]|nr:aminoglycoside phosphotransferase family protein [Akkermansia sp.]